MSDFYKDLHVALSGIDNPFTDGKANYGKYATLSECLKKAKDALTGNNFVIVQMVQPEPDRLVTRLVHTSGEMLEDGGVPLRCVDQNNPQKMGAAITYARRYGLCALLGIVGDADDDAQSATAPEALPKPKLSRQANITPDDMVRINVVPPPPDEREGERDWPAWVASIEKKLDEAKTTKDIREIATTAKPDLLEMKKENPELIMKLMAHAGHRRAILENKTEEETDA